jgi:hypothetical protein
VWVRLSGFSTKLVLSSSTCMASDFNESPYVLVVATLLLGFIRAVVQITIRLLVVLHGGPLSVPAVQTVFLISVSPGR